MAETGRRKHYAATDEYERKLPRVMERLGAELGNWDWGRWGCFVEFRYKGELYRFDHSIEKAAARGIKLRYGSDAFAQVVLALEDLARMTERGIYELSAWIEGMRYLPPPVVVPDCLRTLGFDRIPGDAAEVKDRYRTLAKQVHPDTGGSAEEFQRLQAAAEEALRYMDGREAARGEE